MNNESKRALTDGFRVPLSSRHEQLANELQKTFLDSLMSIDGGSGVVRDEIEAAMLLDLAELPDGDCFILIETPPFDDGVWWHAWSEDRDEVLAWAVDAGDAAGINLVIHRRA